MLSGTRVYGMRTQIEARLEEEARAKMKEMEEKQTLAERVASLSAELQASKVEVTQLVKLRCPIRSNPKRRRYSKT